MLSLVVVAISRIISGTHFASDVLKKIKLQKNRNQEKMHYNTKTIEI